MDGILFAVLLDAFRFTVYYMANGIAQDTQLGVGPFVDAKGYFVGVFLNVDNRAKNAADGDDAIIYLEIRPHGIRFRSFAAFRRNNHDVEQDEEKSKE